MNESKNVNYRRIALAIEYISANFKEQPSLDEIASKIGLSSFHFQRLFSDWAGVSPKKFIQYLSIEYAKQLLKNDNATLLDTAYATGLSGSSRLHDLFVNIEGMTPGEFKNGGEKLSINYHFSTSPFGQILIASTSKGICHMAFEEDEKLAILNLKSSFPSATFYYQKDNLQENALSIFNKDWREIRKIKLHLHGSNFQLKVWRSLLNIPSGTVTSYGTIAKILNMPQASRAVGTAIGKNPVGLLIPCHRVIQKSGNIGGYRWGTTRKSAMIGWEACQVSQELNR